MTKKIDGQCFINMIEYGVRNLNIHRKLLNQINVFPVPDGDTGTNMVVTINNGLASINNSIRELSSVSEKFAKSIVFGARGNSGVIVSQFLKGMSETFFELEYADVDAFVRGLENGVRCAYDSVADPVEGTILTVIKDATEAVKEQYRPDDDIDKVISLFIKYARRSLENTPELLPQLKDAGVVDSGGGGIVYFFEGIKKYLGGEVLDTTVPEADATVADFSAFHKNSVFRYGYCTELLLQLLNEKEPFAHDRLNGGLQELGESIVTSVDDDKVKIHIHTFFPEEVLSFCHRYGEFLSLKIENMTVQHTELLPRILYAPTASGSCSVVAVAYDGETQKLFAEMGADAVINCNTSASERDFIEIFDRLHTDKIVVFPNDADSYLSAIEAKSAYAGSTVVVINSNSIADCYAALPMLDYEEEDMGRVEHVLTEIIGALHTFKIVQRGAAAGAKNEDPYKYCAFSGTKVIAAGASLKDVAEKLVRQAEIDCKSDVIHVFVGGGVEPRQTKEIVAYLGSRIEGAEINTVHTADKTYEMIVSFERYKG